MRNLNQRTIGWGLCLLLMALLTGSRVTAQPDMVINSDGDTHVGRLLMKEPVPAQTEGQVWRNVVVSDRNRRVICIDRYLRKGKTDGYIYVFQSQTKRFPSRGRASTHHCPITLHP